VKTSFLRQNTLMPEPRAKKSKRIFLFLRIAVVVCGVIWGIFWISEEQRWHRLVEIFRQMNIGVFAAVLSIFIIFYNNFMPGSVGGDLLRAWYVTKHTPKKFEAVLSVFVDRVIGLLSTLTIAVFFYLLFLRGRGNIVNSSDRGGFLESVVQYKGILLWVFVAIVVIFCVLLLHKTSRSVLVKVWLYIRANTMRMIVKLKDAIVIYCSKPGIILVVFGLTVFLQLLTITGFWLLGRSMGIEASVKYYYVFFTLTWVLGAVPVSIGGAVVVEVLLASMFIKFAGVGEEPASALALCQRAVWMLASLPGAAIHLIGAHLPKDFFIDYKKSIN
jgi:uncharacterized protein (TIRG00374 family)